MPLPWRDSTKPPAYSRQNLTVDELIDFTPELRAKAVEISKQFALANGPAYQHPRRAFFLDQLPLAGTNKIDQQRLRQWVADGSIENQALTTGAAP